MSWKLLYLCHVNLYVLMITVMMMMMTTTMMMMLTKYDVLSQTL